jgi:hypothetical protein
MLSRCGSRLITADAIAACIPFYRDYTFNTKNMGDNHVTTSVKFRGR